MTLACLKWHEFDGWCASRNVEPMELDPARFMNLVEYWAKRGLDKEGLQKFDEAMNAGVGRVGGRAREGFSREEELAAFMA